MLSFPRPHRRAALLGALATSLLVGCSILVDSSGLTDGDDIPTAADGAVPELVTASETGPTDDRAPPILTTDASLPDAGDDASVEEPPIGRDAFERARDSGLGFAELGGPWTANGSWQIANGHAVCRNGPGVGTSALLQDISVVSIDLAFDFTTEGLAGGSGTYLNASMRHIDGIGEYQLKLHIDTNASAEVNLTKSVAGTESTLIVRAVPFDIPPAFTIRARAQALGTNPTTLRARVWKASDPEPTTWRAETTDATPQLQAAGCPLVGVYVSSGADAGVYPFSFDNVLVRVAH